MAVPASGSLSLRGLANEKLYDDYNSSNTPTNISLTNLATSTGYDPTNTNSVSYPNASTPHGMNEWHGYDHDFGVEVPVNSIFMSSSGEFTIGQSCINTPNITRYIDGPNSTPDLGDIVYTDDPGTIKFNGLGLYYIDGTYSFLIDTNGEITDVANC